MRTKHEYGNERSTLSRLFQNLEPSTLARVLTDVEFWDPEWFFGAFQAIFRDGLWWYDDEDVDKFSKETEAYKVGEDR